MNAVTRLVRLGRAVADPYRRKAMIAGIVCAENSRPAICPCCGYEGYFRWSEMNSVTPARCPRCGSFERHRLLKLAVDAGFVGFAGKRILHFAPEDTVSAIIGQSQPASYVTADLEPGRASKIVDIEAINEPDASFDMVIASHVLEHVDDHLALSEINRVLVPGGEALLMVPLVEGWDDTYENDKVSSDPERQDHFGQHDHVRYYGGVDFRHRVRAAGFGIREHTAFGADCVTYRLSRGEKVFVCEKSA